MSYPSGLPKDQQEGMVIAAIQTIMHRGKAFSRGTNLYSLRVSYRPAWERRALCRKRRHFFRSHGHGSKPHCQLTALMQARPVEDLP